MPGFERISVSVMAQTTTGLKVIVDILKGVYDTGEKCATDFIKKKRIVLDDYLPRWN